MQRGGRKREREREGREGGEGETKRGGRERGERERHHSHFNN